MNILQKAAQWAGLSKPVPQVRRFTAARVDRLTADWMASMASLNEELRADLDRLRARGRDLVKNNDYAVKFAGMVTSNIIGPGGIRLQSHVQDGPGKPDKLASDAIEEAWAEWSQACDITGTQSLRDLCETLVGSLPSDGEFLVRLIQGKDARNKFNFAVQVIDVDRIDTTYNTSNGPGGNAVIMGVEVDVYRRPVALHLFASHPTDGVQSNRQRIRIPADELLHRFKIVRAEQMRGIPWMAPSMMSLHHLGNFKLAALLAAEHGANHYGFFTTPDGQAPIGAQEGGETIATSQPGTYDTLPSGVTFTPHESKYPNEVFGPFVKTTLQRIASGWRVAYHSLANDLEGVSYSSIRSGALEERDRWAADQSWFCSVFMEPVFQAWLSMALLSSAITMPNGSALPAAKRDKFARHDWQPRRWEWVDPQGDMEAKILAVKAGLMAPQDLAASMGYDFDDVIAGIQSAQAAAAAAGVSLTAYDGTPGANSAQEAKPAAKSISDTAVESLQRQIDALQRAPAPSPQIHLDLTAAAMDRAISQAAGPIVRQFQETAESLLARDMPIIIHVPEQPAPLVTVNVDAPVVNVEATVPAAQVVVNNTHPSRAVQTVKRDANDEIVSTETTYTA